MLLLLHGYGYALEPEATLLLAAGQFRRPALQLVIHLDLGWCICKYKKRNVINCMYTSHNELQVEYESSEYTV